MTMFMPRMGISSMSELLNDFLVRALIAGVAVAFFAGPLGCFVIWRRMSYLGDTLAHAALLGLVLSVLFRVNPFIGVLVVVLTLAYCLFWLNNKKILPSDTLLGIMAHSTLAIGLVILSLMPNTPINLDGVLFGNILAVSPQDVVFIVTISIIASIILYKIWSKLLTATISEEIALAEGLEPNRYLLILTLLMAVLIAVTMKIVGILLISSLLIIPAAAARRLASSPESMAIGASIIGIIAVIIGITTSNYIDSSAGPTIVVSALALFILVHLFSVQSNKK